MPVVLLLGLGLMYGVAGVINLGIGQDEAARSEAADLASRIRTQYLTDFQHTELSKTPNRALGPLMPSPSGSQSLHQNTAFRTSCFAIGASAATASQYRRIGTGLFGAGVTYQADDGGYSLGQLVPVRKSLDSDIFGQTGKNASLVELRGRELSYFKIASGTGSSGDFILLNQFGETGNDNIAAHFWLRLPSGASGDYPLLTYATVAASNPVAAFDQHFQLVIGGSGASATLKAITASGPTPEVVFNYPNERPDWLSVGMVFRNSPAQNYSNQWLWYRLNDRLVSASLPTPIQITAASLPNFTFDRDSEFFIGPVPDAASSSTFVGSSPFDLDLATARLWKNRSLSSSSAATDWADGASDWIESLVGIDRSAPGADLSNLPAGLLFSPTTMAKAPNSYLTADSGESLTQLISSESYPVALSGLVPAGADVFINTPDWQPQRGEIFYIQRDPSGLQSQIIGSEIVGGNPNSPFTNSEYEHAAPPASVQVYRIHTCDVNSYQVTTRKRRYTRGNVSTDQKVFWIEE